MFKYNYILKCNELITFKIILFIYNLLHDNYYFTLEAFLFNNDNKNVFYH